MRGKEFEAVNDLGNGSWLIKCASGLVRVWADDDCDAMAVVVPAEAQQLRDFARHLERAADYLEGK